MNKRFSAFILAALMMVSVLPVFAADSGVAKYNGQAYDTLQDAIDAAEAANDKNIVIDLLADATLDIDAWENLAIGGAAETVTINGNGKTLTFNKINSDWNNISTIDAKLILNDMTLADSGHNNGPWNRYDHNFECVVELNNIVSVKPLAFKTTAVLNNVKITDTNDVYAIWIQPNGQDISIDGLEVEAGRGIKIDEQYVSDPGKVCLSVENATFTTAKKSAILVKSSGGADITVENIDISGVAADSVNAVWTDEDAAATSGPITVTGATQTIEGAPAVAPVYGGPVMNWVKVNAAENGVVKSGPLAASAGATITLYPKASEGYVLDTVEVLDAEGNAVQLDGMKFQVPLGGVTVNATFKAAE